MSSEPFRGITEGMSAEDENILRRHWLEHHCIDGAVSADITHFHPVTVIVQEPSQNPAIIGSAEDFTKETVQAGMMETIISNCSLVNNAATNPIVMLPGHSQLAVGTYGVDNPSKAVSLENTVESKGSPCTHLWYRQEEGDGRSWSRGH
nr:uncharacterized protein I203_02124 [Kwoniella mangroviensis CBS 8507]OCF68737.1 hypothetical protein I203_02124 [Kwoniella mangroviensis CBS 8507]